MSLSTIEGAKKEQTEPKVPINVDELVNFIVEKDCKSIGDLKKKYQVSSKLEQELKEMGFFTSSFEEKGEAIGGGHPEDIDLAKALALSQEEEKKRQEAAEKNLPEKLAKIKEEVEGEYNSHEKKFSSQFIDTFRKKYTLPFEEFQELTNKLTIEVKNSFINALSEFKPEEALPDLPWLKLREIKKEAEENAKAEALGEVKDFWKWWENVLKFDLKNLSNEGKAYLSYLKTIDEKMQGIVYTNDKDKIFKQHSCLYQGYAGLKRVYGDKSDVFCGFYVSYFLGKFFEYKKDDEKKLLADLNNRDLFNDFLGKALKKVKQFKDKEYKGNQEKMVLSLDFEEINEALLVIGKNINDSTNILGYFVAENRKELIFEPFSEDNGIALKRIREFFALNNPDKFFYFIVNISTVREGIRGHWILVVLRMKDEKFSVDIVDSRGVDRIEGNKVDFVIDRLYRWITVQFTLYKKELVNESPLDKLKRALIHLKQKVQELSTSLQTVASKLTILREKLAGLQKK